MEGEPLESSFFLLGREFADARRLELASNPLDSVEVVQVHVLDGDGARVDLAETFDDLIERERLLRAADECHLRYLELSTKVSLVEIVRS